MMKIRVFIVDDHAIVRDGLKYMLSIQKDMTVVGDTADGRQAVAMIKQVKPDVVIMDIALPKLNGIEATQQITQFCPSAKVIILSMFYTAEHIFRAFQAGARGYLLKEAAGAELLQAIPMVHQGKQYLSEGIHDISLPEIIKQLAGSAHKTPLERLSPREREILQLVAEGKSSLEIAQVFGLSAKSVETYRSRLMGKLKVKGLANLIKFAVQNGLTTAR